MFHIRSNKLTYSDFCFMNKGITPIFYQHWQALLFSSKLIIFVILLFNVIIFFYLFIFFEIPACAYCFSIELNIEMGCVCSQNFLKDSLCLLEHNLNTVSFLKLFRRMFQLVYCLQATLVRYFDGSQVLNFLYCVCLLGICKYAGNNTLVISN